MQRLIPRSTLFPCVSVLLLAVLLATPLLASSHREAPGILGTPQVDGTDFYMFRSYEPGREGYVTLVANYNPLQDPYGGPNYFPLDGNAFYDIHIDNDGDAEEDITFRFRVFRSLRGIALDVGGETVAVPLINVGPIGAPGQFAANSNEARFFNLRVIEGPSQPPAVGGMFATNLSSGMGLFPVPLDNIGGKTFDDYPTFARRSIKDAQLPGCEDPARVFVGQRQEPFAVNLGEVFDLVNLNPVGPPDAETSDTADKNITSLVLEVPISCLTSQSDVIAGWTTSWSRQPGGSLMQVSRLGHPLVNEVVIGLPDKDRFNTSHPSDDAQFLTYVTNPTLPVLLQALFGVQAPTSYPRNDLVQVFLTGVPGLNDDGSVGEMLRLNTAIDPTPRDQQDRLGVIGGDLAGFPNGRRPGDDVVDIALRAVMGVLLPAADAPDGQLPYTDGAIQNAGQFQDRFPYLNPPLPGSPNATP